jgi:hypothetical protein
MLRWLRIFVEVDWRSCTLAGASSFRKTGQTLCRHMQLGSADFGQWFEEGRVPLFRQPARRQDTLNGVARNVGIAAGDRLSIFRL